MSQLIFNEVLRPSRRILSLTYHQDHIAGDLVKMECGENELSELVPSGKIWNVQIVYTITERDA